MKRKWVGEAGAHRRGSGSGVPKSAHSRRAQCFETLARAIQREVRSLFQPGNGLVVVGPEGGGAGQEIGRTLVGIGLHQFLAAFEGGFETTQAQRGLEQEIQRVAVLGLAFESLAADSAGAFEVHRLRRLQVEFGQQQAPFERGGVFVENLIDGEFGFAGEIGKGEQPGFEDAGFGALAGGGGQLVEDAASALPPPLADLDFAEADPGDGAVGCQFEDAVDENRVA